MAGPEVLSGGKEEVPVSWVREAREGACGRGNAERENLDGTFGECGLFNGRLLCMARSDPLPRAPPIFRYDQYKVMNSL